MQNVLRKMDNLASMHECEMTCAHMRVVRDRLDGLEQVAAGSTVGKDIKRHQKEGSAVSPPTSDLVQGRSAVDLPSNDDGIVAKTKRNFIKEIAVLTWKDVSH